MTKIHDLENLYRFIVFVVVHHLLVMLLVTKIKKPCKSTIYKACSSGSRNSQSV